MAKKIIFSEGVFFRAPTGFNAALHAIAAKRCTTVGNLARMALAKELAAEGVNFPVPAAEARASGPGVTGSTIRNT